MTGILNLPLNTQMTAEKPAEQAFVLSYKLQMIVSFLGASKPKTNESKNIKCLKAVRILFLAAFF